MPVDVNIGSNIGGEIVETPSERIKVSRLFITDLTKALHHRRGIVIILLICVLDALGP